MSITYIGKRLLQERETVREREVELEQKFFQFYWIIY